MSDFGPRGERLMQSLIAQDATLAETDNPIREVAISACETADRVAFLEKLAREVDAVVEARDTTKMHPVFSEVRQQSALLARLIAALRLPDEATGKRPQRRQIRGVQKPSQVGTGSARDMLRAVSS